MAAEDVGALWCLSMLTCDERDGSGVDRPAIVTRLCVTVSELDRVRGAQRSAVVYPGQKAPRMRVG